MYDLLSSVTLTEFIAIYSHNSLSQMLEMNTVIMCKIWARARARANYFIIAIDQSQCLLSPVGDQSQCLLSPVCDQIQCVLSPVCDQSQCLLSPVGDQS